LYEEHTPRHSKIYHDLIPIMENVFTQYRDEVKARIYPGPEHTVYMNNEEIAKFAKEMNWETKLAELDAAK
jgi:3-methyl-2-oxobutanoate hydroxymethyltransferase